MSSFNTMFSKFRCQVLVEIAFSLISGVYKQSPNSENHDCKQGRRDRSRVRETALEFCLMSRFSWSERSLVI